MPPWITDAVLVALVTGVLGIVGGRMSSAGSVRSAAIAAAERERELVVAPYRELAERVTALEREAEQLRRRLDLMLRRESLWQAGWDKLRREWPEVRQRPDPPPYPVEEERD